MLCWSGVEVQGEWVASVPMGRTGVTRVGWGQDSVHELDSNPTLW